MFKRIFDLVFSMVGLIIMTPILLLICILIKVESKGPVFYRGIRVGKDKKTFRIFKFRTMVTDAEKIGGPSTTDNDPRITKIGRLLRKYKLDELPQLVNVLKGEMSLVGPRPEVVSEVGTYEPEWDVIFAVKPGITDLSSIEFRNEGEIISLSGIKDAHEAYRRLIKPRKLELQREYVQGSSLSLDLRIILKTVLTIVKG